MSNSYVNTITGVSGPLQFTGASSSVLNNGSIIGGSVDGVYIQDGKGFSITNNGAISGTQSGVFNVAGTDIAVTNSGTISGSGPAIYNAGGTNFTVSNSAGGVVAGGSGGIYATGNTTIVNQGEILATGGRYGIELTGGGVIIDSGTIGGPVDGISLLESTARYVSPLIIGHAGTIIRTSFSNRLELLPGYAISGNVVLNNIVTTDNPSYLPAHGSGTEILELGSGATAGTISGLGSKFSRYFNNITIDNGAVWTFTGNNTLASGDRLINSGTDFFSGGTFVNDGYIASSILDPTGTFENHGTVIGAVDDIPGLDNQGFISGSVSGTGSFTNHGTVLGGFTLSGTSALDNQSRISGASIGVYESGATIGVTNSDVIVGGTGASGIGVKLADGGSVSNSGQISSGGYGVLISGGGTILNTRYGLIAGGQYGVLISGGGGTVVSNGAIIAGGSSGAGIGIAGGGSVTLGTVGRYNFFTIPSIVGASGVVITGGPGQVIIDGNVLATGGSGAGVSLNGGGNVALMPLYHYFGDARYPAGTIVASGVDASGVAISGGTGTVSNAGLIDATGESGVGVTLAGDGIVSNETNSTLNEEGESRATIAGQSGVIIGTYGTVTNAGIIAGSTLSGFGIDILLGGTVFDSGTITGYKAIYLGGAGNNLLQLGAGYSLSGRVMIDGTGNRLELTGTLPGTVENIDQFHNVPTIVVDRGANWALNGGAIGGYTIEGTGTLTNTGSLFTGAGVFITQELHFANQRYLAGQIFLASGSDLQNLAGGRMYGANTILTADQGGATVMNAGLISSGAETAIYLGGAGDNLLQLAPGSELRGDVVTNGTNNQIELLSGSGTGALSGVGNTILGFSALDVDANASWLLTGSDIDNAVSIGADGNLTLVAGDFVSSSGDGIVGGQQANLYNDGAISGALLGVSFAGGGSVTNGAFGHITGEVTIGAGGALNQVVNAGNLDATQHATDWGVALGGDDFVSNAAGAYVYGEAGGVSIASGTLINAGFIGASSANGLGVAFGSGFVSNASGGTISGGGGGIVATGRPSAIDNAGSILGTLAGTAWGVSMLEGGSLTNEASGLIVGMAGGVSATGFPDAVSNAGTITGTVGVSLGAGGSVANTGTAAKILSQTEGVAVSGGSGTITNSGTIRASASAGVGVLVQGNGTVSNTGLIAGGSGPTGFGVDLTGGGTVIDTGTIIGGTAIYLGGAGGNLLALGAGYDIAGGVTITGTGNKLEVLSGTVNAAVLPQSGFTSYRVDTGADLILSGAQSTLAAGDTLSVSGTVSGATALTLAGNNLLQLGPNYSLPSLVINGTGNRLELLAGGAGVIPDLNARFTNVSSIAVDSGANWSFGGDVTVGAGTLVSGAFGITDTLTNLGSIAGTATIQSGATLANPGSITGMVQDGGTLINATSGVISAGAVAVAGTSPAAELENQGHITAAGTAVALAGGMLTNAAGGTIAAGTVAVLDAGAPADVDNQGRITAGGTGVVLAGGTLVNAVGATISAATIAVLDTGTAADLENQGQITGGVTAVALAGGAVTNTGTAAVIQGTTVGVQLSGFGSITNTGTIRATGGIYAAAVSLLGGGELDNAAVTALISARTFGIIAAQAATVENSGTIMGRYDAVTIAGAGRVDNIGAASDITGLDAGIVMSSGVVTNAGQINASPLAGAYGVKLSNGGTIVDTGTISGHDAIYLGGAGGNELALGVGYSLSGSIVVQGTANTFELMSGTASAAALPLSDFSTIVVDPNATLALSGIAGTIGAGITLRDYGTIIGGVTVADGGLVQLGAGYAIPGGIAVTGGNTKLELLSGSGQGTVSSGALGAFGNFSTVAVDAGAGWAFAGTVNVASGVTLGANSNVTVTAGATLTSPGAALFSTAGNVTVADAGLIGGATAVSLGGGGNLVQLAPGYALQGRIVVSGAGNRLELAGTAPGTVSGIGSSLVGFASVTVDAGATWTLAGDTIAAGVSLTNIGGTLTASGLTNAGAIDTGLGQFLVGAAGFTNQGSFSGGITLGANASVTNAAGATISSVGTAVGGYGVSVAVFNQALITSSNLGAIYLAEGGSVTNTASGQIVGNYFGVELGSQPGTLVNDGRILATNRFGSAVGLESGGTLVDSGTISGYNALYLGGTSGSNLLQLESGYSISGRINLSPFASNTVALSGSLGAVSVNYDALGLGRFSAITFDNVGGAPLDLQIGATSGTVAPAIDQFVGQGDTIDLTQLSDAGNDARYTLSGNRLTIIGDNGSVSFNLGSIPAHLAVQNDGANGTDVTLCFVAGTLIGTPDGEVPVERLRPGDLVLTAQNGPRTVTWMGQGKVLATRGTRSAATPVIVRKGALANNVPTRDLHVTKGHALYIDNLLIPVEFLVNHRSILWDDRAQEVALYHVELESHDVLIANGAPAESYRDDGNRWLFRNANSGWHLPPQDPYAPVLTGGPLVDAVWRRLLDRAGPRALPPLTDDPDLHLIVDGVRVDAQEQHDSVYVFRIPPHPKSVLIASRSAVPSELGFARDPRPLGVALRRVAVRQGTEFVLFDAADDRLTVGFHAYEPDCNLRWTDGCADLPAAAFARFNKGAEVMLHLGGATLYLDDGARAARVA